MNRIHILILIILLQSCKEKDSSKAIFYNQKANELIGQIIWQDSCDCILEFNSKSIVDYYKRNLPSFNFRKSLQSNLKTHNLRITDSLVALSNNFRLDSTILYRNNKKIKVITETQLLAFRKDTALKVFKICPKSIRIFQKPIFSEDFKTAVIHQSYPFGCDGGLTLIYKYKNENWFCEELEQTAGNTR